jgi:hypothetical protein
MLTDEGLGIEFQGSRGKWSAFGKRLLVLVAGEMVIHSEVMRRLFIELKDTEPPTTERRICVRPRDRTAAASAPQIG